MTKLPTREQLLNPVMLALVELGGSGSVDEINERVIKNLKIPETIANTPHDKSKQDGRTELEYELAWARTMLKSNNYIVNSKRGVWAIFDKTKIDVKEIQISEQSLNIDQQEELEENWKSKLLRIIIEKIKVGTSINSNNIGNKFRPIIVPIIKIT